MLRSFPRCCAATYWEGDVTADNVAAVHNNVVYDKGQNTAILFAKPCPKVEEYLTSHKWVKGLVQWRKHDVYQLVGR